MTVVKGVFQPKLATPVSMYSLVEMVESVGGYDSGANITLMYFPVLADGASHEYNSNVQSVISYQRERGDAKRHKT